MPDPVDQLVPAHTRTVHDSNYGTFCNRGERAAPGGRCPDGCDHENHYANDGHPECSTDIAGNPEVPC